MYKILIAEDHELIRFGIKTAFENKTFVDEIIEVSSGEEAVNVVKNQAVDAVIMDLGLPSMDGIEATQEIKKINGDIKVIILTSHDSEDEVIKSVKAGAGAYCSKDINPERLTAIVRDVIDGALWFDPKIANIILNALKDEKKTHTSMSAEYNLTDRERDVLDYICEGLNNAEISRILDVSVNTVKVHVSNIIQKLGVEDRTQVVVKAYKSLKHNL